MAGMVCQSLVAGSKTHGDGRKERREEGEWVVQAVLLDRQTRDVKALLLQVPDEMEGARRFRVIEKGRAGRPA